jgi:hypothetical protein
VPYDCPTRSSGDGMVCGQLTGGNEVPNFMASFPINSRPHCHGTFVAFAHLKMNSAVRIEHLSEFEHWPLL